MSVAAQNKTKVKQNASRMFATLQRLERVQKALDQDTTAVVALKNQASMVVEKVDLDNNIEYYVGVIETVINVTEAIINKHHDEMQFKPE